MMKNQWYVLLSAVLAGAALVFTGCGKGGEKTSEKVAEKLVERSLKKSGAKDADVDMAKGKMKFKTNEGEFEMDTGAGVALPADFPKDVASVKAAKVQMAMKTPQGFLVQMRASDDKAKVAEAFGEDMQAKGWEQEASVEMDDVSSRSFKKNKRQVTLVASKGDEGTEIMLTVAAEE